MQTYADYANDSGLGFGFDNPNENFPTLRRASDCGGSEIYFICDDESLAQIDDECGADDYCCHDPLDENDDQGLIAFWAHVEKVIKDKAGTTYDSRKAAEKMLSARPWRSAWAPALRWRPPSGSPGKIIP